MKDPNFTNSVTDNFEEYKDKLFEPYIQKNIVKELRTKMKKSSTQSNFLNPKKVAHGCRAATPRKTFD
tara:strand:+ start:181 stop:384 length:204 start_codon:yes stop_codon:yes gene_type:complete